MSQKLLHISVPLIFFLFIQGCDSNQNADTSSIKEEMASRELKRVPKSEILDKGMELGNRVSELAQSELKRNLMAAIEQGQIEYALEFCNVNAYKIVSDFEDSLGVKILRVSDKWRNPKDQPDSIESLILEAYQYNAENDLPLESSITALSSG
jgi:hypothetical protein